MNKKIVRLTESDLHRIVKESVDRVLNEISDDTLLRAHKKAVDDYNDAIARSPYWDDWDNEYPEEDKYYNKRRRQIEKFTNALRDRGINNPSGGNGWDMSDN